MLGWRGRAVKRSGRPALRPRGAELAAGITRACDSRNAGAGPDPACTAPHAVRGAPNLLLLMKPQSYIPGPFEMKTNNTRLAVLSVLLEMHSRCRGAHCMLGPHAEQN